MRKIQTVSYAPEHGAYGWIDLYWPETTAPCPMFIYFHGGGLTGGDRAAGVQSTLQRLAAHGIAVASVEYRLMRFHNGQLCSDSPQFPDFVMDGYTHCAYCGDPDVFAPEIEALIASGTP